MPAFTPFPSLSAELSRPRQYEHIRAGRLTNSAKDILRAGVAQVLRVCAQACAQRSP